MRVVDYSEVCAEAGVTLPELIAKLQSAFNRKALLASVNLVRKNTACEFQSDYDGEPEPCQSQAIMQRVEIIECGECHKTRKTVLVALCLQHAIFKWGADGALATIDDAQLSLLEPGRPVVMPPDGHDHSHDTAAPAPAAAPARRKGAAAAAAAAAENDAERPPQDGEAFQINGSTGEVQRDAKIENMIARLEQGGVVSPDHAEVCACGFLLTSPLAKGQQHTAKHQAFIAAVRGGDREAREHLAACVAIAPADGSAAAAPAPKGGRKKSSAAAGAAKKSTAKKGAAKKKR